MPDKQRWSYGPVLSENDCDADGKELIRLCGNYIQDNGMVITIREAVVTVNNDLMAIVNIYFKAPSKSFVFTSLLAVSVADAFNR